MVHQKRGIFRIQEAVYVTQESNTRDTVTAFQSLRDHLVQTQDKDKALDEICLEKGNSIDVIKYFFIIVQVQLSLFSPHHTSPPSSPPPPPQSYPPLALSVCPVFMFLDYLSPFSLI